MDTMNMSSKNSTEQDEQTVQTSLFGGLVSHDEDAPLTFLRVYAEVAEPGDVMHITLTGATFNEDRQCLTVIDDTTRHALTVYFENHPDAQYRTTTDGVRLGRAVERCLQAPVSSYEGLAETIKAEAPLHLTVTRTGPKGRLWTIERA